MADHLGRKEIDLDAPLTEERMKELLELAGREMFGAAGA